MKLLLLSLLCCVTVVSTFSGLNVALYKEVILYPESQSNAPNAVDGNDRTEAYTGYNCRNCSVVVNLGDSVYIKKIKVLPKYARNLCLLTSNKDSPERPSLLSSDWTIRYFHNDGSDLTVSLYLDELSSHVAVYNEYDSGWFGVNEIEVYDYDVGDKPRNLISSSSEVYSSTMSSGKYRRRALDQNIDMFAEYSYFSSEGGAVNAPHWWRVKLSTPVANQCVVKVYPFLRKKQAYSSGFSRLSGVDVMLSGEDQPEAPLKSNSEWVQCVRDSDVLFNYYTNGPVTTTCEQTVVQVKYVGLYKAADQALELAEVQVYETEPKKPATVTVTPTEYSHVSVTWTSAQSDSSLQYRWRCAEAGSANGQWSRKTSSMSATSSSYTPGTQVTCYVISVSDGGTSDNVADSATIPCDTPNIGGVQVVSQKQDSYRVKADVTWQAAGSGCSVLYSITVKMIGGTLVPSWDREQKSETSYIYTNLYPNARYRLSITATGDGLIDTFNKTYTTVEIPPVFAPSRQSITVSSASASCVKLEWPEPEWVNGILSRYSHSCIGGDVVRNDSTPGTSPRERTVCGFSVRTSVTCKLTAINGGGTSNEISSSGYTACDGVSKVTSVTTRDTTASGSVTTEISWPPVVNKCLVSYAVTIIKPDGSIHSTPASRTSTSVTIYNLKPYTRYTVSIVAYNDDSTSENFTRYFRTKQIPPSFGYYQKLTVSPANSSCVKLEWPEPRYVNGIISNYKYSCYEGSRSQRVNENNGSSPATSSRELTRCGFSANTRVECRITASNDGGESSEIIGSHTTYCGNPTGPQLGIVNQTSEFNKQPRRKLTVSVSPQSRSESGCNRIVSYDYYLNGIKGYSGWTQFSFDDLDAVTEYTISVVAINNAGNRSEPGVQRVTTGELAPYDAPEDLRTNSNSTCVSLSYKEPNQPNGIIIHYTIECNNTLNKTEQRTYQLCEFKSASKVVCAISASTAVGHGPNETVEIYTEPKVNFYPSVSVNRDVDVKEGTIAVTFNKWKFDEPLKVKNHLIIVELSRDVAEKRNRRSTRPTIDKERILFKPEAEKLDLGYYLTANFTDADVKSKTSGDKFSFIVGDGLYYGGAYNAPLETGRQYYIRYGISFELDGEQILLSPSNNALLAKKPENNVWIVGAVLGGILAAALVIAIVLFVVIGLPKLRQKRKNDHRENPEEERVTFLPTSPTAPATSSEKVRRPPLPPPEVPEYRDRNNIYENTELQTFAPLSTAIRLEELEEWIKNNEETIVEQYQVIEKIPGKPFEAAHLSENSGKNRYRQLYPYDDYRVELKRQEYINKQTDYINASYVPDCFDVRRKEYVAAMAPNENTINDFWFMIYQEKIRRIVMVTNLIEEGKVKCERYWPEKQGTSLVYDGITVTLSSEVKWAHYCIREFKVSINQGLENTVTQYHYISWPDHGVPQVINPFVMFYEKICFDIKRNQRASHSPILVHCSAGVGRTGTYLALDQLVKYSQENERVDVFECVKKLRDYRPHMVQKLDQYKFLYEVVVETLTGRRLDVISDGATAVEKIREYQGTPKTSRIYDEFQVIERKIEEKMGSSRRSFLSALENPAKNADPEVLADDKCRLFISTGDNDYINAILVDSAVQKDGIIVTQVPLPSTIDDFWNILEIQKVHTIVQLEHTEVEYFGTEEGWKKTSRKYEITLTEVTNDDDFNFYKFELRHRTNVNKPMRYFRVISPISSDTDRQQFIKLYHLMSEGQRLNPDTEDKDKEKVIVMCRNGAKRCGLFINVCNALEKLSTEQEVDVFNSVMLSKLRREQFITSMEEYFEVYQIVNDYLQSYEDYSNFIPT